ncbi:hypothetical protein CEXT_105491 [Caerostris extrusa]|uniref:Uncharacterized protein n=1 Tax=Caerostris extrusa TaxID=172846 RepID=A0AAV4YBC0_CAEEX|nr:hypothetical protein CEXT_105491 [Caerostris extrusa]
MRTLDKFLRGTLEPESNPEHRICIWNIRTPYKFIHGALEPWTNLYIEHEYPGKIPKQNTRTLDESLYGL